MRRYQFFPDLFGIQRSSIAETHPSSTGGNAIKAGASNLVGASEYCLFPAFSLQRSPPFDVSMGAIRGFVPISPDSTAQHRTYPGGLIVRVHPANDLDMPSAYWSEIASALIRKELSLGASQETVPFANAPFLGTPTNRRFSQYRLRHHSKPQAYLSNLPQRTPPCCTTGGLPSKAGLASDYSRSRATDGGHTVRRT